MDRFIRESECREITGMSRTTRWREERAGRFPRRHRISKGVWAYRASEIKVWLDERSREVSNEFERAP